MGLEISKPLCLVGSTRKHERKMNHKNSEFLPRRRKYKNVAVESGLRHSDIPVQYGDKSCKASKIYYPKACDLYGDRACDRYNIAPLHEVICSLKASKSVSSDESDISPYSFLPYHGNTELINSDKNSNTLADKKDNFFKKELWQTQRTSAEVNRNFRPCTPEECDVDHYSSLPCQENMELMSSVGSSNEIFDLEDHSYNYYEASYNDNPYRCIAIPYRFEISEMQNKMPDTAPKRVETAHNADSRTMTPEQSSSASNVDIICPSLNNEKPRLYEDIGSPTCRDEITRNNCTSQFGTFSSSTSYVGQSAVLKNRIPYEGEVLRTNPTYSSVPVGVGAPKASSNQSDNSSEFTEVKSADGQNFTFENFEFFSVSERILEKIKVAVSIVPSQVTSAAEYGTLISKVIHLAPHRSAFSSPVDFIFVLPDDSSFSNIDVLYSPTDFMEESRWEVLEKHRDERGRLMYCDGRSVCNYVMYEERDQRQMLRFLLRHFCSYVIVKNGEKCGLQNVHVYTSPVDRSEIDVAILAGNQDRVEKYRDDFLQGFTHMICREMEHWENGGNFKIQMKISGLRTQQEPIIYNAGAQLNSTVLWQRNFDAAQFVYSFDYNDHGKGVPLEVLLTQENRTNQVNLFFRQKFPNTDSNSRISEPQCVTPVKETLSVFVCKAPKGPVSLHSSHGAYTNNIVHSYCSHCGSFIPIKTASASDQYISGNTTSSKGSVKEIPGWELKEEGSLEAGTGEKNARKIAASTMVCVCPRCLSKSNKDHPSSNFMPNELDYENMACGGRELNMHNRGMQDEMDYKNMACGGREDVSTPLNGKCHSNQSTKGKSQIGVAEEQGDKVCMRMNMQTSTQESGKYSEWRNSEELVESLDHQRSAGRRKNIRGDRDL